MSNKLPSLDTQQRIADALEEIAVKGFKAELKGFSELKHTLKVDDFVGDEVEIEIPNINENTKLYVVGETENLKVESISDDLLILKTIEPITEDREITIVYSNSAIMKESGGGGWENLGSVFIPEFTVGYLDIDYKDYKIVALKICYSSYCFFRFYDTGVDRNFEVTYLNQIQDIYFNPSRKYWYDADGIDFSVQIWGVK